MPYSFINFLNIQDIYLAVTELQRQASLACRMIKSHRTTVYLHKNETVRLIRSSEHCTCLHITQNSISCGIFLSRSLSIPKTRKNKNKKMLIIWNNCSEHWNPCIPTDHRWTEILTLDWHSKPWKRSYQVLYYILWDTL